MATGHREPYTSSPDATFQSENVSLHMLREAEIEAVLPWFASGARVLDFGGGNGFQARALARRGYDVSAIDVAPRSPSYFPVLAYDGRTIPFEDDSFDVVFSSNVLEHVPDLPNALSEIRRVLRPGGRGVHLVPSATWRFWTMLTHYPWLVTRLALRGRPRRAGDPDFRGATKRLTRAQLLWRASGLSPHGEYGNAIAELYYFSRRRWVGVFEAHGIELEFVGHNGLFYTGNSCLGPLPLASRRRLARALGASCHVLVTR